MKNFRLWTLAFGLAVLSGCTSTTIKTPTWSMSRISFLHKADIGLAEVSTNGTARLKGYKSSADAEAAALITEAAVRGAVKP